MEMTTKTTSELIDDLRNVGRKLDTASDPAEMAALITERKTITSALVALAN